MFAGLHVTRSNPNDSGSRSRPARWYPRLTVAEHGAIGRLGDHGTPTNSRIHREVPETLRVSAGDGYFESDDAGATWRSPNVGLEVGYLRSVAIDPAQPEVVVVSASSGPYSAYVAGRWDGRLYRRLTRERWERVHDGWPESATTIPPLLCAGVKVGGLWAADERGVHRSDDGGKNCRRAVGYATSPQHLRRLVWCSASTSVKAPDRWRRLTSRNSATTPSVPFAPTMTSVSDQPSERPS